MEKRYRAQCDVAADYGWVLALTNSDAECIPVGCGTMVTSRNRHSSVPRDAPPGNLPVCCRLDLHADGMRVLEVPTVSAQLEG